MPLRTRREGWSEDGCAEVESEDVAASYEGGGSLGMSDTVIDGWEVMMNSWESSQL